MLDVRSIFHNLPRSCVPIKVRGSFLLARKRGRVGNAIECRGGDPGVRQRSGLTQGALARQFKATVGALPHWEVGRSNPSLARLLALRQIYPRGQEWTQVNVLIRETQARPSPRGVGMLTGGAKL